MIINELGEKNLLLFKKAFQSRVNITEAELLLILPYIRLKQFEKGDLITQEGEIENRIYFILQGVTRSFFFKQDKEISFEFYFEGSFINSYASFIDQKPSTHAIEAFTALTAIYMERSDLEPLLRNTPKLQEIMRIFTQELFKKSSERIKDLLSLSATERYLKLLQAHPQYVRNIPLKYLASYLNITPESLSRIRKSIG